jgi:N-methylhydantoinase A/oxoprolinase/acetone carboxylase beta subunit
MKLSVQAARDAVAEHVAVPLGLSIEEAAWGIHELAIESMATAARVVSVDRGRDPREFAMVAFGGAGPAHAARMAQRLGVPLVIAPRGAGVASAIGLLSSDVRFEVSRTAIFPLDPRFVGPINELQGELECALHAMCGESKLDPRSVRMTRSVEVRYAGQGYELTVPLDDGQVDAVTLRKLADAFHARYELTYGYSEARRPVEAIAWRLSGVSERPNLEFPPTTSGTRATPSSRRVVYFPDTGFDECAVYERTALTTGAAVWGPAIIQERECTTVLPPGCEASVDARGNLLLSVERAEPLQRQSTIVDAEAAAHAR